MSFFSKVKKLWKRDKDNIDAPPVSVTEPENIGELDRAPEETVTPPKDPSTTVFKADKVIKVKEESLIVEELDYAEQKLEVTEETAQTAGESEFEDLSEQVLEDEIAAAGTAPSKLEEKEIEAPVLQEEECSQALLHSEPSEPATGEEPAKIADKAGFLGKVKRLFGHEKTAFSEEAPAAEPAFADMSAVAASDDEKDKAWQNELILALRQATPRLSEWLKIVLQGVSTSGPLLGERLLFFFNCLEVPEGEAKDFIDRFERWLKDMGYEEVELFRSELQYRLALALDLEDEEDERDRLFVKLSEGVSRTREQIGSRLGVLLSSKSTLDEDFWEQLEETFILADMGMEPTLKLTEKLRSRSIRAGINDPKSFIPILSAELGEIFKKSATIKAVNPPEVVLVIGVNGVGKTTTIAKLAHRAAMQGRKVLIAAADTFRAAAIDQLRIWADRVGAGFYAKGENSDPAAVAFEALDKAVKEGFDCIFIDTAGRLHTKANLMEEMKKIKRVLAKKHPGSPHRSLLVLDATTGQNALSQTKLFSEAVGIDEIILTKLDGTSKGGVIVGIALSFGIPITFIGLGEKMEDLRPFSGEDFAKALLPELPDSAATS